MIDLRKLEIWAEKPEYSKENKGFGMCNTGSGIEIICMLGGIGCNVDHRYIWQKNNRKLFF